MLSIQDMNQLIKSYAYRIQQRMEELDRLHCSQSTTDSDSVELGEYECGMLVLKYQGYTTTNEREMKYIGKLVERALQIYEFFKLRNQNQNLLTVIQGRITSQFQQLLKQSPLPVGEVLAYMQLIAKKGCVIRIPAEKRRIYSKSTLKEVKQSLSFSSGVSTNILQRKANSVVSTNSTNITSNTNTKTNKQLPTMDRQRLDQLVSLYSVIDLDKHYLLRSRQASCDVLRRQMSRRNEKIASQLKKYERMYRRVKSEVDEPHRLIILCEAKNNYDTKIKQIRNYETNICETRELRSNSLMRSIWGSRKKRPQIYTRLRKATLMKQNMRLE